jgi:hypothetical protein
MEDWPLHILNAQFGKIGYLDHVMGDYRNHSGNLWSSKSEIYKSLEDIKFYKCVDSHLKFKYHNIVKMKLSDYYYKLALLYNEIGENKIGRKYFIRSFLMNPDAKDISRMNNIKLIFKLFNPYLYDLFQKVKHGIAKGEL